MTAGAVAGCSSDSGDEPDAESPASAAPEEAITDEVVEGEVTADAPETEDPGAGESAAPAEEVTAEPVPAATLGDEVAARYQNEMGITVTVRCPADLAPEVGATVTCDADLDGTPYTLLVTATSVVDGVVGFEALAAAA